MTTSGRPASPVAGSATSASSGTPANVVTRVATVPGQKRTPSCGAHAWVPKGAGAAAAALAAGTRTSTRAARRGRVRRRMGATTRPRRRTCDAYAPLSGGAERLGGRRRLRRAVRGGRPRADPQRDDRDVVARRARSADGRVVHGV